MVNTNAHPLWNAIIMKYIFGVNGHSSAVFYTIFWGSMFPDFSMFVMFFYYVIQGESMDLIFDEYYYLPSWTYIKDYLHSMPLNLLLYIIFYSIDYFIIKKKHLKKSNKSDKVADTDAIMEATSPSNELNVGVGDENETIKNNSMVAMTSVSVDSPNNNMDPSADLNPREDGKCERILVRSNSIHNDIVNVSSCRTCWYDKEELYICTSFFFLSMFWHSVIDFPVHADDAHAQLRPLTSWTFYSPVSYWDPRYYGDILGPLLAFFNLFMTFWVYRYKRIDWYNDTKCVRYTWKFLLGLNSFIFVAELFFRVMSAFD